MPSVIIRQSISFGSDVLYTEIGNSLVRHDRGIHGTIVPISWALDCLSQKQYVVTRKPPRYTGTLHFYLDSLCSPSLIPSLIRVLGYRSDKNKSILRIFHDSIKY